MLLHNKNKKDIEVNCNFAIKDSNGAIVNTREVLF
jgi:hypothetical protein